MSVISETTARPTTAKVTDEELVVDLEDGRTIITPLLWYPRLLHGTMKERNNFEVGVFGIHWPDLDEDLSVAGMLAGRMSSESPTSLHRWIQARERRKRSRKMGKQIATPSRASQ